MLICWWANPLSPSLNYKHYKGGRDREIIYIYFNHCMYHICLRHRKFSSVAQTCPTLCDPMDCSRPGLSVHHQLLELTQSHVYWVGNAIQPSHPLSSLSPLPSVFPSIRVFPMSQLFASSDQSIGVSASASEAQKSAHWISADGMKGRQLKTGMST